MKQNYNYKIVNPIGAYESGTEIEEMEEIEVNLEICTLYRGEPHGLAIISFKNPEDKRKSFKGVGVFNRGKLHNSPFIRINGRGEGYKISKMLNGRPASNSF